MHACGHDGHTAILLGTAAVLVKMKSELAGNVKFVFQPAVKLTARGSVLATKGLYSKRS
jgi:amidohydrolase